MRGMSLLTLSFYRDNHIVGGQGLGKPDFFRSQTKIQKLEPIGILGNSPKPQKIGPILAQYLGNFLRFCQIFKIFSNSKLT